LLTNIQFPALKLDFSSYIAFTNQKLELIMEQSPLTSPFDDLVVVKYAQFWPRFVAYFLDGIIVAVFNVAMVAFNFAFVQSFWFYLPITLIGIAYKPYLESKYGATLGKMALNLKVTGLQHQQIDIWQSLKRSAIFIIPVLLLIPFEYMAYNNPAIASANGFFEFAQLQAEAYPYETWISYASSALAIIDLIVLLSDKSGKQQSLHDQIGQTYVIQK